MKVYLACSTFEQVTDLIEGSDILVAFPYMKESYVPLVAKARNFILDSGVFTMINGGKRFKIDEYLDKYADFVREHKIKQYVEMDTDQIYGVEETRKMRERLEKRVGWQSIPVWHTIRGKESFEQDCRDYPYIALGYFLTEGLSPALTLKYAANFVKRAHELDCRIHGLGFTQTTKLESIGFDSVDSSTWTACCRYGYIPRFDYKKRTVAMIPRPAGTRLKNSSIIRRLGYIEWKKYQDYAYHYIRPIWH